jgi:hypothetical protein
MGSQEIRQLLCVCIYKLYGYVGRVIGGGGCDGENRFLSGIIKV